MFKKLGEEREWLKGHISHLNKKKAHLYAETGIEHDKYDVIIANNIKEIKRIDRVLKYWFVALVLVLFVAAIKRLLAFNASLPVSRTATASADRPNDRRGAWPTRSRLHQL